MHIRFLQSFQSYEQGKAYFLPEDIALPYVKAGVAELVDFKPVVVGDEPEEKPEEKPEEHKASKRKKKSEASHDDDVSDASE